MLTQSHSYTREEYVSCKAAGKLSSGSAVIGNERFDVCRQRKYQKT
jgi:hypothetical protein